MKENSMCECQQGYALSAGRNAISVFTGWKVLLVAGTKSAVFSDRIRATRDPTALIRGHISIVTLSHISNSQNP